MFSPLKRKVDSDDPVERKEKRLKESITNLGKSTNKPFSGVVNADGKKGKSIRQSTRHDELRTKEREMEKETGKALLAKKESQGLYPRGLTLIAAKTVHVSPKPSVLGISTKDNLPAETFLTKTPWKSILKDTTSTRLQARSPSPRRRISLQEDADTPTLPELEKESPIPTLRRKSPGRQRSRVENDETASLSPLRPVTQLSSPKKVKSENDLWTSTMADQSKRTVTVPSTLQENQTRSPIKRINEDKDAEIASAVPAELGSMVLEIQTGLRRDIERLRLDMVRQFVSFRSEMGQKWEGEVERLRQENEVLRTEIHTLRREREKLSDGMSTWKLV